jgi:hypothetical protein
VPLNAHSSNMMFDGTRSILAYDLNQVTSFERCFCFSLYIDRKVQSFVAM